IPISRSRFRKDRQLRGSPTHFFEPWLLRLLKVASNARSGSDNSTLEAARSTIVCVLSKKVHDGCKRRLRYSDLAPAWNFHVSDRRIKLLPGLDHLAGLADIHRSIVITMRDVLRDVLDLLHPRWVAAAGNRR